MCVCALPIIALFIFLNFYWGSAFIANKGVHIEAQCAPLSNRMIDETSRGFSATAAVVFSYTRVTHTRDRRERRAVDVVLVRQVVRTERHAAVSRYRERTGPSSLLRVIGVTCRPTACLGLEEAKVERA